MLPALSSHRCKPRPINARSRPDRGARRQAVMRVLLLGAIALPTLLFADACGTAGEASTEDIALAKEAAPYARLSEAVYATDTPAGQQVGDWTLVPGGDFRDDETGFHAAVYKDDDGNYVVAYQGTDATSLDDWITNAQSAFTTPDQYLQAMSLAIQMKQRFGDKVTLTGHSLGGGLCQAAANATGLDCFSFNPANISEEMINAYPQANGRIVNIVNGSEILNDVNTATDYLSFASKLGETQVLNYDIEGQPVPPVKPVRPSSHNPLDHAAYAADSAKYQLAYAAYLKDRLLYKVSLHNIGPMANYLDCLVASAAASADDQAGQAPDGSTAAGGSSQTPAGSVDSQTTSQDNDPCRQEYDASAALAIQKQYQSCLEARDYACLKSLRARKQATDLWEQKCKGRGKQGAD